MAEKTLPENLEEFFSIIELSFAAQKNDMLLRNMIFRLNVEMIDSTASNMIFLLRKSIYSV